MVPSIKVAGNGEGGCDGGGELKEELLTWVAGGEGSAVRCVHPIIVAEPDGGLEVEFHQDDVGAMYGST